jgi:transcriptional regulator with XRE-family HTH domain
MAKKTLPKKTVKVTADKAPRAGSRANQEKKDLAKLLFTKNDLSQKEVAARVGVTEKTLGNWVRDGKWEDMRKSLLVTKENELRNLIDQLSELNAAIKNKPEGQRYANSKEGDVQIKITSAIRRLTTEAGLTEVLEISTQILGFTQKNFPEHITIAIKILDAYVQQFLR